MECSDDSIHFCGTADGVPNKYWPLPCRLFRMIRIQPVQTEQSERMAHMRDRAAFQARRVFLNVIIAAGITFSAGLAGCGSSKPAQQPEQGPKRYQLAGRVVSVEPAKQQVVVDGGDIPGFMMAMTMGYSVKDTNLLAPLSAEDKITADVVVNGTDVYLENIVVVKKANQAKPSAASDAHPASSQPSKQ
jgi:Cu/Ag efflux protein CusF